MGHTAKVCHSKPKPSPQQSWPQANMTASDVGLSHGNWVLDSGATHHITSDLQNLSLPSDYTCNDDIIVGNGTGISISHTGFSTLHTPTTSFTLNNILCAPSIKKNLISVSQFCTQNNTSIEFFPHHFLMKDLSTRASMVRGWNRNNLYEWLTSTPPLDPPLISPQRLPCGINDLVIPLFPFIKRFLQVNNSLVPTLETLGFIVLLLLVIKATNYLLKFLLFNVMNLFKLFIQMFGVHLQLFPLINIIIT